MSDLLRDELPFLRDLADAVVEASRVKPGESVAGHPANDSGGVLIRPGGRDCYPAFWIRDYAMSVDTGLISLGEQKHALTYTLSRQQRGDWQTPTGSVVPGGAVPDHINFDGAPIYFPGTYVYDEQGGAWGELPAFDNPFYVIKMAYCYVRSSGDTAVLADVIDGRKVIDRLDLAFAVPPAQERTHLVICAADRRGVNFGFMDSIVQSGVLLFASVLKYRAARQLSELHELLEQAQAARRYEQIANLIRSHLPEVFAGESGLLKATTGLSSQNDVWGSAFAVCVGAVEGECRAAICQEMADAYAQGTLAWRGSVRHVRTCDDFSDVSMWERTVTDLPKNVYQNGAYWGTPLGWVCYAIAQADPDAAAQLAGEYLQDLRGGDFRRGEENGVPWECVHPDNDHRQNAVYMTSVTCPLVWLGRLV